MRLCRSSGVSFPSLPNFPSSVGLLGFPPEELDFGLDDEEEEEEELLFLPELLPCPEDPELPGPERLPEDPP